MTAHAGRERWAVPGALLAVQVFFAVHYVAAKVLLRHVPPLPWAAIRVTCAALLLLAAVRIVGRRLPADRGTLARLALYSLFGVTLNQVLFVEGLSRTTPVHSSLINTSIPVATLGFALAFRKERLTARKLLSIGVALAGVLLILHPERAALDGATWTGDLLTLANGVSYALFLVISKDLMHRVDALGATAVLLAFGALMTGAVALPQTLAFDFAAVPAHVWAIGAFIVLLPTAGAYLLISWALARAESSLVALFIYVQPLLAGLLSVALLGERPGPDVLAGGALIALGVFLALRREPRAQGSFRERPRPPRRTAAPPRRRSSTPGPR